MNDLRDKPFALLGIHVGGSTVTELKAVMEGEKLPWRSFVDLGNACTGPIATSWNTPSTPTFYVLDSKGVIRHKWVGKTDPRVVDAAVDALLKERASDGEKRER